MYDLFFSFVIIFTQAVDEWSPRKAARYLHIGQHKYRINAYTDVNVFSGIRINGSSVGASEDSSYLTPRGRHDRQAREV
jgi:hypothetical protein